MSNRPDDVCALCDRPIDRKRSPVGYASLHRYLGPGWIHGGGRNYIAVHHGCAWLGFCPPDAPVRPNIIKALWGTQESRD
jgi:hypothetical protein